MNLLNLISNFLWRDEQVSPALDLTAYKITTRTHQYFGIIVRQDDVIIKFRSHANKPVKILKSNIKRREIVALKGMVIEPITQKERSLNKYLGAQK